MTAATSHRNVGRALWFLRQQPPSEQAALLSKVALPCLLNQNPWSSALATRGRSCCTPDTDHLNVPLILQPVACRTQRWGVWTSNMDELTAKPDLKVTDPWKKRQRRRESCGSPMSTLPPSVRNAERNRKSAVFPKKGLRNAVAEGSTLWYWLSKILSVLSHLSSWMFYKIFEFTALPQQAVQDRSTNTRLIWICK